MNIDNEKNKNHLLNEAKPFALIFKKEKSEETIVENILFYQKKKNIVQNIDEIDKSIKKIKSILLTLDDVYAINLTYYLSYIKNLLCSRKYYERQLTKLFFVTQIEDHENKKK